MYYYKIINDNELNRIECRLTPIEDEHYIPITKEDYDKKLEQILKEAAEEASKQVDNIDILEEEEYDL